MVQPTIIANCGEGETGKSDSIKQVYVKLCKIYGKDPGLLDEDICETLKINNTLIGIAGDGDTLKIVEKNLKELTQQGCPIILTACRSNHDMIAFLKSYAAEHEYRLWRTSNARLYEEATHPRVAPKGILDRFNDQWAEEIANLIESWCYAGKEEKRK